MALTGARSKSRVVAKADRKPKAASKAGAKAAVRSKAALKGEKRAATDKARQAAAKAPRASTELAEIVARISDWAGGPRQALAWCREVGIPALGGRTAEKLVEAGQAQSVLAFLDHIAVGGFA